MADFFSYVDAGGETHFTNLPDDPRYQRIVNAENGGEVPKLVTKNSYSQQELKSSLSRAASLYGVDQALLEAVVIVESKFNPRAHSSKGAVGLMQLMPETARRYHVSNLYDPDENIRGGAQYLRDLLHLFDNNLPLTIAAYNAGEGAVLKYQRQIPPFKETMQYVPKVMYHYHRLHTIVTLTSR
jgi:soluble lytic murein transglycosylase-like protein